jgi:MYXO-CTERM domain-containing protein
MRRLCFGAIAATTALAAAPASAKEVQSATVCGADACRTTRAAQVLHDLTAAPVSAPVDRPYYRVTVRIRAGDETFPDRSLYVPSTGAFGLTDHWLRITGEARAALDELTRGLEPFPAAGLERAGGAREAGYPVAGQRPADAYAPAARTETSSSTGGVPAGAVGGAVGLLALLALGAGARRHRRASGATGG